MPSTTSGISQASGEKPSQMVSRTSRPSVGMARQALATLTTSRRAPAGVPDQDAQRDARSAPR